MTISPLMLDRAATQLLVVDIQDKLFRTFKKEVQESITQNVKILLAAAKQMELPLIVTEQYPRGLGPTVQALLDELDDTPRIDKVTFSCLGEQRARDTLAAHPNHNHVVMVGIETHICVYQTALDLVTAGYAVHVPQDAVGSRTKENWKRGLALIEKAGAVVSSTETVLFQLLKEAGTPDFKALAPLVR